MKYIHSIYIFYVLFISKRIRGHWAHFSKNSVSLEMNWDISILFEDLTSVETPPPMGGCMGELIHGWGQVKSLKIE